MITQGFEQLDPTLGALNLSSIVVTRNFIRPEFLDFHRILDMSPDWINLNRMDIGPDNGFRF